MRHLLLVVYFLVFYTAYSQKDTIYHLNEVVLFDNFSPAKKTGFTVTIISDSVLQYEPVSLGVLLARQSNLYFKQNGSGMVSSISFRGTTAAQTGVYWNEIPINSSLNGQTDFNTINASGFDALEVRSGGGSVLLGSGAIGGAINLRDRIVFENDLKAFVRLGYGSYQTFNNQASVNYANEDFYLKLSGNFNKSENDYPFTGTDLYNENGQYRNYGFQGVAAWKRGMNTFSFHAFVQDNDRNTSRTLTAESNAKLLNHEKRFLFNWKNLGNRFTSDAKVAFLNESYTYIFDRGRPEQSEGESLNLIGKYDFTYFFNEALYLKTGMIYTHANGSGDNIHPVSRNDLETYILIHHKILPAIAYNASIRKGISSAYDIPFIYALDAYIDLNKQWRLKTNITTNYRLPTFNDLYWKPGGNPDLRPETNTSGEFGVVFADKSLRIDLISFLMHTTDMIQWVPGTDGLWHPQNVKDVTGYGMEFTAKEGLQLGTHALNGSVSYSYTVSTDNDLEKQLIYVPYHKGNLLLGYEWKDFYSHYNLQYTGSVFTTTSNSQTLDAYWLSNIDLGYKFLKDSLLIGLRVNNLFDKAYQSVAYRPMPNRNFEININYKL